MFYNTLIYIILFIVYVFYLKKTFLTKYFKLGFQNKFVFLTQKFTILVK
jgi:hypothetical protein